MVPNASAAGIDRDAAPRIEAPNPADQARADLHCHSTASQLSKLGVQRSAGLPECATPPDEVYELAKRRGMDFVTITDHDTIDGVLQIADLPDVFISEELTAHFRGEDQAVHVLTYGISPEDHEWLQRNRGCVESCAEYLRANNIACALAHPFYAVEAPLTPRHRRRLTRLFDVWEIRNGSRAPELNMPAAVYIETHGGTGVAGSDDHAGVDIGRTFTRTPAASTPEEFLAHIRAGRTEACGEQGSAAKWAHSALALAARSLAPERPVTAPAAARRPSIRPRSCASPSGSSARAAPGPAPRAASSAPTRPVPCSRLWLAALGFELGGRADPARCRPRASPTRSCSGAPAPPTTRPRRGDRDAAISALSDGEPELAEVLGELFARARAGRPLRAGDDLPRRREAEAGRARRPVRARRPGRRLDRLDAWRLAHDRADPRARRARL